MHGGSCEDRAALQEEDEVLQKLRGIRGEQEAQIIMSSHGFFLQL